MAEKPQFTSQKVTSITGKNARFKRDGYGAGEVPPSMLGTKAGLTEHEPYSGPNVARASRG